MSRIRTKLSKHWCWTLNNPQDQEVNFDDATMTYLIGGEEICPKTGTLHIQGYTVFKVRKRLSAVKKVMPRAHWEIKMGTITEASDYCKKDGKFAEFGTIPQEQKETAKKMMEARWQDAKAAAKIGDFESIPASMLMRYYHSFKRYHQDNPVIPDDLEKKDNYWIIAPSQHGKSRYVRKRFGKSMYDKAPNKWFTGYLDQETLLCDDFGPQQCQYLGWYMKRWADEYAFPMGTKGGGKFIRPKHVVVTSQYEIYECWEDPKVVEAITNRFQVIHLDHWKKRLLRTDEELEPWEVNQNVEVDPDTFSTLEVTQPYDSDEHSMYSLEERYAPGPDSDGPPRKKTKTVTQSYEVVDLT